MKLVKKEYVKYLEWAFKLAYLLLGLVTFNAFLYDSPVQPLLVKGCLILGALALLGRMIYWKDYVKTPYLVVLVLFCASFGISILVNWKYGAGIADMKWMIWTGFLFFLLYMCDTKREKSSYKKEFHFFSHVLLLYSGGAAAVSLYLMQTLYHAKWFTSGNELMLAGFYWGRLWGVYTDPNYGGAQYPCGFAVSVSLHDEKKLEKDTLCTYSCSELWIYSFCRFPDCRIGSCPGKCFLADFCRCYRQVGEENICPSCFDGCFCCRCFYRRRFPCENRI